MKADEDLIYIYISVYLYIYLTALCLLGNAFEPYAKAEDALGGAFTFAVTNQHAAQTHRANGSVIEIS